MQHMSQVEKGVNKEKRLNHDAMEEIRIGIPKDLVPYFL